MKIQSPGENVLKMPHGDVKYNTPVEKVGPRELSGDRDGYCERIVPKRLRLPVGTY